MKLGYVAKARNESMKDVKDIYGLTHAGDNTIKICVDGLKELEESGIFTIYEIKLIKKKTIKIKAPIR